MTSEHAQTAAMFTILESCWVIYKEMDTREDYLEIWYNWIYFVYADKRNKKLVRFSIFDQVASRLGINFLWCV